VEPGDPHQRVTMLRGVFVVIGLLALVCGYVGLRLQSPGSDLPDILYNDLQLFVLGADALQQGGPYPWELEVARFAAPAVTLYTLFETFRVLLAIEVRRLRASWAHGHAVVCGDSWFARTLAMQLFNSGERVIMVRSTSLGPLELRHSRLFGMTGDPTNLDVLRGAGVRRARSLYVCDDDDDTNHAISTAASRLLHDCRDPAWVHVQVHDPEMCQSLQARRLGAAGSNRLRLDYFHADDVAARALYRYHPLKPVPQRETRLLIVGSAPFWRPLLVETARYWRSAGLPINATLHVDLVARDASTELWALFNRYPFLASVGTVHTQDFDVDELRDYDWIGSSYDRIFLCLSDERRALAYALSTPAIWRGGAVFVPLYQQAAIADAFHGDRTNDLLDEVNGRLRLYPILTRACDPKLIAEDLTEHLARLMHREYLAANGGQPGAAMVDWARLPESLRIANRAQVQDIAKKLAALDCVVAPRNNPVNVPIDEKRVEELAREEHERWTKERNRQGWQYGKERDEVRRLHPDLCPWEEIQESSREKNREAIRRLPTVLADAGFEIISLAETSDEPAMR